MSKKHHQYASDIANTITPQRPVKPLTNINIHYQVTWTPCFGQWTGLWEKARIGGGPSQKVTDMINGKFTAEERAYLASLDAVLEVRASSLVYAPAFKQEAMARYRTGDKPSRIFADAGLPASLIGHKRIERAIYHWKEADAKGALTATKAPQARRRDRIARLKNEKREAVERQRAIRAREQERWENRLTKEKKRAKTREEKIIASQAARIAALEAQVKALKALGRRARAAGTTPERTSTGERFAAIAALREEDPGLNITAACQALEVSRSGYYDWIAAAPARARRERADLADRDRLVQAYAHRGFSKGTRQVRHCLARTQNITMNRKKIQRLTRKYGLRPTRRRKRPYRPIAIDGEPQIAPNTVNRNFRTGRALTVLSTDITYLPSREGFTYLSAVLDCETSVLLARQYSRSLKERFVLETCDQLARLDLPEDATACSDQGVHYTAHAYRAKLKELRLAQSMSRRACCWDNAPIESFWGRMKEEIGPTSHLSHDQIVDLVDNYIDYYNNERGHARLGWLTPTEYARKFAAASPPAIAAFPPLRGARRQPTPPSLREARRQPTLRHCEKALRADEAISLQLERTQFVFIHSLLPKKPKNAKISKRSQKFQKLNLSSHERNNACLPSLIHSLLRSEPAHISSLGAPRFSRICAALVSQDMAIRICLRC